MLLAHNFNWEWGDLALGHNIKHDFLGVYMPISNKVFDRLFFKVRSKTGAIMLSATDMRNAMIPYRNRTYMLALVADQNAGNVKQAYWLNFFGRPAPFVKGPERGAKTGNLPVIFCRMIWLKRGYYRIEFEMGEASPAGLAEGALTRKYVDYLEKIIRAQPENWLWSHKRWKHSWKEEYGPVL